MNLRQTVTACLLGLVSLSGCTDQADVTEERLKAMRGGVELKPVFPVSGTVKVDGSPVEGVSVLLYQSTDTKGDPYRESRTDKDGKYCYTTAKDCDGVEAGTYLVAFTHIPKPRRNGKGVDLLKGKYKDPKKNKFELIVKEGAPQENVNYELTTK